MRFFVLIILLILATQSRSQEPELAMKNVSHLANLALECIHQEYPNKPGHVMDDSDDVLPPQALHPAFYGCFDWHSAVHGHWMLIALVKNFPGLHEEKEIRSKINHNLTPENIQREVAYFSENTNRSFERTYGWAWLMKLAEELYTWDDPQAQQWYQILSPLVDTIAARYMDFLPKLTYPNRTGEHPNTAFGISFAWDWAEATGHGELLELIRERCMIYYFDDKNCPVDYEPGGFDFISPCLAEADMMGRILAQEEYAKWIKYFLEITPDNPLFLPATVTDRSDGKLVHLDGLNLFKASSFYRMATYLPSAAPDLMTAADHLLASTLPHIQSGEYAGEHWLGSFAVYAFICRGLNQ
jgi:hypothetical protein